MPDKAPVIDLIGMQTIRCLFEVVPEYSGPDKIEARPHFSFTVDQNATDQELYKISMRVRMGLDEKPGEYPYNIEVVIEAIFRITNVPEDKLNIVFRDKCAAVIFPYMRATLSSLMTCAGTAPYIIPILDMDKVFTTAV